MKQITISEMEDLQYSSEYAEFIMNNASGDARAICNGHMLTDAMESLYLFDDFLMSQGLECVE